MAVEKRLNNCWKMHMKTVTLNDQNSSLTSRKLAQSHAFPMRGCGFQIDEYSMPPNQRTRQMDIAVFCQFTNWSIQSSFGIKIPKGSLDPQKLECLALFCFKTGWKQYQQNRLFGLVDLFCGERER